MTYLEKAISRIKKSGKGLWGFECPEGARFDPEVFLGDHNSSCTIETLSIRNGSVGRYFESCGKPIGAELELEDFATNGKTKARQQGFEKVRIVITDFHTASEEEQYQILCEARRIQEQERSISFQFIVCGRWSHYLVKAHHDQHGSSLSPPTDSKNASQVPYANEENILTELCHRGIVGTVPTDLDKIGCAFLLEQTGGDWFLVRQAIDRVNSSPWTDSIEQHINELESSPDVFEEVSRRLRIVSDDSQAELKLLLRTHRLLRPIGRMESEELWLVGLARKTRRSGGEMVLEIASPVIDAVTRQILSKNECGLARSNEICYRRTSIAIEAYRRVADLENLLRNIIVAEWRFQHEDKWKEKLAGNKTPARGHENEQEIAIIEALRLPLLQAGYDLVRLEQSQEKSNNESTEKPQKRKTETLLSAANNWQSRQQNNHSIRLQNDNTMHFLTTESLVGILEDKKNHFHGIEGQMFKKQELHSALEEYTAIRAAVAHNQPLKLSMIAKLDNLLERFLKWLTVYADQSRT
ncbi:MAG: hypothetical protein ACOH2B_05350 [Burkholderiaceae bacterium]